MVWGSYNECINKTSFNNSTNRDAIVEIYGYKILTLLKRIVTSLNYIIGRKSTTPTNHSCTLLIVNKSKRIIWSHQKHKTDPKEGRKWEKSKQGTDKTNTKQS